MKVVILCGGEGTRMKEETEFKPKPLVEVGGKAILWHIMKIYSHYGFNEFILTLGYKGQMIKDYFLNSRTLLNDFTLSTKEHGITLHSREEDDFKITFVDTGVKALTGERVRRVRDYIGKEDFMLTYGDGVADINIHKLLEFHKTQGTTATITGVRPLTKFGIVNHDEQTKKVVGFKQNLVGEFKQKNDQHDFVINGGFMVFKNSFLDLIAENSMIEEAFIPLTEKGDLSMFEHQGKWKAMDTYKEVEEMNEYWQKDPFWKVWEKSLYEKPSLSFENNSAPVAPVNLTNPVQITESVDFKGKRVLITGAHGLVGGHLTEELLKQGALVFVTSRDKDPRSYFFRQGFENQVVTEICDINDAKRVKEVILKNEIEYVFHLAAQALVRTAFLDPVGTLQTNIMGTVNVLEACRVSPYIKGVVVASSDKAYGKNCVDAKEDQKLSGDHPYDVSKSATDLIALSYFKTYGLPVTVSRFGNIFGPGDLNFNRIVPGTLEALFKDMPLQIRSDGKFVRDYVFVKDVVDGYLRLALHVAKTKGQAYNFSTGYILSVLDIISRIESVVGKKCRYEILNIQVNEIPFQSLNFEKAVRELGWVPKFNLDEAMFITANWYREYLLK